MTAVIDMGQAAVMTNLGRFPKVVHRLAVVRPPTFLYPYVMECGAATSAVAAPAEGLKRCSRCWKSDTKEVPA